MSASDGRQFPPRIAAPRARRPRRARRAHAARCSGSSRSSTTRTRSARSLQAKAASGDTNDPGEALRLAGPPTETITLEAELDVTDQLEHPDDNATEASLGLLPRLAALEALLYPPAAQVQQHDALARAGTVEILPIPGPLVVFVWSPNRVVPVRLTELSIVEQAFDTNLRPIRAKVSLSLRVLSVDDLGFATRGGSLAMTHHLSIEQLAARAPERRVRGPRTRGAAVSSLPMPTPPDPALAALAALPPPSPVSPTSRYANVGTATFTPAGRHAGPVPAAPLHRAARSGSRRSASIASATRSGST